MLNRLFTEHPGAVGETYVQHLHSAGYFGTRMIVAGLGCLVHGLFPFLFQSLGSRTISHLHEVMVRNRRRTS